MNTCPDFSVFEGLAVGRVDKTAVGALHEHLEHCATCRRLYADIRLNNQLLSPLREALATSPADDGDGSMPIGRRIGRYTVIGLLGRGGMATVYRAEQDHPRREVALKVIRRGLLSRGSLRRFAHEAELLGRLQHPNIAQIFEAGVADDDTEAGSQPYFAMELIQGSRLTEYASVHWLGTRQRVELMVSICDAVHYAHQKGIIHRDLKPGNILVTHEGGDARPKILDFGVARATDADLQTTTLQTDVGQLIGTLPYMSPEQVSGDPNLLDARSDVYALGVVCYELLADCLPYEVKGKSVPEAVRVIREEEPTPLSSWNKVFRGDLETIVSKVLEKDKTRRYASAAEFAADLRQYLNDAPIAARPPSVTYQLGKFARRNKALVGGVAAAFLALSAGLFGTGFGLIRATRARTQALEAERIAQTRRVEAETVIELLNDMLGSADPHRIKGADYTVRQLLDEFSAGLEDRFKDQPEVEATIRSTIGNAYRGLGLRLQMDHHLRRAVELRRQIGAPDDLELAQALHDYGWALRDMPDYPSAERVFQEALAIRKQRLGLEHQDVADTLTGLSDVLFRQDKFVEAESLAREAVRQHRDVLYSDHPRLAEGLRVLGVVLLAQRRNGEEAETSIKEAIAIWKNHYGSEHPATVAGWFNLGCVLNWRNKHSEARDTLQEALAVGRKVYGDDHHEIANIQRELGNVLREIGDFAAAELHLRDGLRIQRLVHGDEHVCVSWNLNALAALFAHAGRFGEAEEAYREALRLHRMLHGDDHSETTQIQSNLADLLVLADRPAEAEPLARQVLKRYRDLHGEHHYATANAMRILGLSLIGQGEALKAEPLLRESVRTMERLPDIDVWRLARTQSALGECLAALGRYGEAEPLLSGSHRTLLNAKGWVFSETAAARRRLASLNPMRTIPDSN